MKVLIVEDEPLAAEHIKSLVLKYESHINIVGMLESVREAVAFFRDQPAPDLLLLDIHLADGLSFSIFDQVQVECPVIFTTAYDEYALRAFKSNSIDYLLKPIHFDALATAMDRYVKWFQQGSRKQTQQLVDLSLLRELMQGKQEEKTYKSRFVVKKGEHLASIPVEDILYFYAEDKVTLFKTTDGKRYLVDPILGEIEEQLNPTYFFRINRSFLIHHAAIDDMISYSNRRLKIILKHPPEQEVIVSREKVTEFKEWLDR
ncbi:MAG: LytTR family DNA-binding domain-containing protein [Bacteroidia bacterium]|nr:LytTR family DNA-binding domain-containing protein [Bacteroidia bacterium]